MSETWGLVPVGVLISLSRIKKINQSLNYLIVTILIFLLSVTRIDAGKAHKQDVEAPSYRQKSESS